MQQNILIYINDGEFSNAIETEKIKTRALDVSHSLISQRHK